MNLLYLFGMLSALPSIINSMTINCDSYKNLWSINNDINGKTISSVQIFMCINDPYNLYNNQKFQMSDFVLQPLSNCYLNMKEN